MKLILLSIYLFSRTFSKGFVCSEDELIRELKEDIEDNGKQNITNKIENPHKNKNKFSLICRIIGLSASRSLSVQ